MQVLILWASQRLHICRGKKYQLCKVVKKGYKVVVVDCAWRWLSDSLKKRAFESSALPRNRVCHARTFFDIFAKFVITGKQIKSPTWPHKLKQDFFWTSGQIDLWGPRESRESSEWTQFVRNFAGNLESVPILTQILNSPYVEVNGHFVVRKIFCCWALSREWMSVSWITDKNRL